MKQPFGLRETAVWPADLDNDGDKDILNASELNDTITWIENLGSGNFGAAKNNNQ
jgi:hypothetical protein